MKKNLNKRKVLCLFLLIIDILLVSFILIMIYNHIDIKKRKKESFINSYTESSKVTYKVNMLDNDYLTSENFGNSNSYILKYTDNILFNFSYTYTSSKNIKTLARYKIVAQVSGSYKKSSTDSNEIYNKKFILDSGILESTNNTIILNKDTIIDLNNYDSILRKLQENLRLPLIGKLDVYLTIDTSDENDKAIDSYTQSVNVSLLNEIYSIDIEENDARVRNLYSDDLKINYVYLTSLGVAFVSLIVIMMFLVRFIFQKKMTKGEEEANKYLRVYDDFIVNIDDTIDESKYEVVTISEFKELLTLANNNSTSIFYFSHDKKAFFYVPSNDYLYEFVIDYRN